MGSRLRPPAGDYLQCPTWWFIPLTKYVITLVFSVGKNSLPFITYQVPSTLGGYHFKLGGYKYVITYLVSVVNHHVPSSLKPVGSVKPGHSEEFLRHSGRRVSWQKLRAMWGADRYGTLSYLMNVDLISPSLFIYIYIYICIFILYT